MAPHAPVAAQFAATERPPNLWASDCFPPHVYPFAPRVSDRAPFYPCNVAGEARRAMPTLMSTVGSYSFRDNGPGMV